MRIFCVCPKNQLLRKHYEDREIEQSVPKTTGGAQERITNMTLEDRNAPRKLKLLMGFILVIKKNS